MAPPPELPDTDDPFKLLGVKPDCGLRELKRAYVRLIKTYRPDTSPFEFGRIREAFEEARDYIAVPETAPAAPERNAEGTPRPQDERFAQAHPSKLVLSRALSRIERTQDRPEAPLISPEEVMRAEPQSLEIGLGTGQTPACVEQEPRRAKPDMEVDLDFSNLSGSPEAFRPTRSVANEREALGSTLEQRLAHALKAGYNTASLESALTPDVIAALSRTPALDWKTLRNQRDVGFATRLFQRGAQTRAALGSGVPVLTEYKTDALQQDTLAHPALVHVLYDVMGLTCWDDAAIVEELLALYPPAASESNIDLDWLDAAIPPAREWQRTPSRARVVPGLLVLLRTMKLELRQARTFVNAPLEQLAFDPNPWLESLDTLTKHSPASAELLLHRIDTWLPPDVRTWDEMEQSERDWVIAETERLGSNLHFIGNRFLRILGIAAVIAILTPTGIGLILMIVYAVWRTKKMRKGDTATYRERLRPAILEAFAARGMTPEIVREAKIATPGKNTEIARFLDLIERDRGLTLAAALYRLRLALTPQDNRSASPMRVTGRCTEHPLDEAVCVCTYCQRKACEACTLHDTMVPDYCRDCADKQAHQKRQRCLRGEGAILFARLVTLLGSVLAAAACAVVIINGNHLVAIAMAAFAGWGLLASMALHARKPWAATNQRILWLPMLLAFPIGTVASVMIWRTFGRPDVNAVLSKDYPRTLALAPTPRPSRMRTMPEILTAAVVVLIVVAGITADPRPAPVDSEPSEATAPATPPEKHLLEAIRALK